MTKKSFQFLKVLVSGHHIYADAHEAFNAVAVQACQVEQETIHENDIHLNPQQTIEVTPTPTFVPVESVTVIS